MKKMTVRKITFTLILSSLVACQTQRVVPVSQRPTEGIEKFSGDRMVGQRRSPTDQQMAPEIFVKRDEIVIEPVDQRNTTGSLFNLDDERNYLFVANPPLVVGKYIDVAVTSNRVAQNDAGGAAADGEAPSMEGIEGEILASLPHLGPLEKGDSLVSSLRMRVDKVFPNGDVIASLQRRSVRGVIGNAIDVKARVPFDRLTPGFKLTTKDLSDVHWFESLDGQITERHSSAWEDEYTARISGFEEAMSPQAVDIARKEKQLQESRQRMEGQLRAMGAERELVAREREQAFKMRAEVEQKVAELEEKVREREQELQRIRPAEDKPGDMKDGFAGQ